MAAGQASRGSYSVWVLPLPTRFSQASEPRGSPQAGCGWQRARWRASRRVGPPFAPLHRPLTPAPGSASSVVGGASACPVVLIESQGGSRGGSFSDPALTPAAALPALGRSFPSTGQLHCGPQGPSSGRTALPVRQEGRLLRGAGPGGGAAPGALAARALSSRRVLRTPALTPCFSFPLSFSACRQRGLRSGAHELQTLPSRSPQGSSVALTHLLKFVKISSEICCHLSEANMCLHLIPPASCLSVLRYLVTWLPCSLSSLKGSFHRLSSMLLCWSWERDSFSILYS